MTSEMQQPVHENCFTIWLHYYRTCKVNSHD